MKKLVSLVLALVILAVPFSSIASAQTVEPYHQDTGTDHTILASMDAAYADNDLKAYLSKNGIHTQAGDQLVAVLSHDDVGTQTTLQVVKESGNQMTEYFLWGYDDEGNRVDAPIELNPNTRAMQTFSWKPGDETITISATGQYYLDYTGTYPFIDLLLMYPQGLSFHYTYNGGYVPVSSINMALQTMGLLYDSDGNFIEADHVYNIYKCVDNPNANVTYSATGSIPSGYKIARGGDGSGIFLVMEATVNGRWDLTNRNVIIFD